MLNENEILLKLQEIINDILGEANIDIDTDFEDIPELTSLKQFILIEAIEQEFSIEFQLTEIVKITSIRRLIELIESRLQ
jgi:acyl carrier protein